MSGPAPGCAELAGVALALACGCSFSRGGLAPGDAAAEPDTTPPADMGADADAATPDMGCPDPGGPCCGAPEGRRLCVDEDTSGSCAGGVVVIDRSCPAESDCNANPTAGYDFACEIEIECAACYSDACAAGEVCAYFADPAATLYCCVDAPDAGGEAYDACDEDDDCKSGLCLFDEGGGPAGFCFWSCMDGCPAGGSCLSHEALVDGIEASVRSCVPG